MPSQPHTGSSLSSHESGRGAQLPRSSEPQPVFAQYAVGPHSSFVAHVPGSGLPPVPAAPPASATPPVPADGSPPAPVAPPSAVAPLSPASSAATGLPPTPPSPVSFALPPVPPPSADSVGAKKSNSPPPPHAAKSTADRS